jgi:hypothetical protein
VISEVAAAGRPVGRAISCGEARPLPLPYPQFCSGFLPIPKELCPPAQGLRGPRCPGCGAASLPNPNGVEPTLLRRSRNPLGVEDDSGEVSQGSACAATLGCGLESRWDSKNRRRKLVGNAGASSSHWSRVHGLMVLRLARHRMDQAATAQITPAWKTRKPTIMMLSPSLVCLASRARISGVGSW